MFKYFRKYNVEVFRRAVQRKANLEVRGEEKPTNGCVAKKSHFAHSQIKKSQFYLSQTKKKPVCAVFGRKIPTADISREKKIQFC